MNLLTLFSSVNFIFSLEKMCWYFNNFIVTPCEFFELLEDLIVIFLEMLLWQMSACIQKHMCTHTRHYNHSQRHTHTQVFWFLSDRVLLLKCLTVTVFKEVFWLKCQNTSLKTVTCMICIVVSSFYIAIRQCKSNCGK